MGGRTALDTAPAVEPSDGRNRIDASVRDTEGRESILAAAEVIYTGAPATPDLCVLTFGVSDYADEPRPRVRLFRVTG